MTTSSTASPLPADVDPRLWFLMPGCEGRHYLVDGNPHTFHGRMYFYCPPHNVYTRISKSEISECSDETTYFIRGFLSGNEPPPPRDDDNDLLDDGDPRFGQWRKAVEVFRATGYWWSGDTRQCETCGSDLLPSEPGQPPCLNCLPTAETDRGGMRFIRIPDGNAHALIDPGAYLEQLTHLAPALPQGARAFATDPDHYDFSGKRCVKDLKLAGLAIDNSGDETAIEMLLRHDCCKHDDDLTIRYSGVHEIAVNLGVQSKWPRIDPPVILDEILPHKHGCSHEIALHGGTVFIACRDLTATWTGADCPDKNPAEGGGR